MRSPLEQAQGDSHIVGGADQLGGFISRPSLPAPHDLLDTVEIGALLFPRHKFPVQAAWKWIRKYSVPTQRVGGRLRVCGLAILDELRERDRAARRARRSHLRTVAS